MSMYCLIFRIMMKAAELNDFIRYVQKRCLASADSTRSNAIEIIKIEADVRDVMLHILGKIEQNLKNYLL